MIVDWHSHVWTPEQLGSEWGPELDANVSEHVSELGDYDAHRAAMDSAGVDVSVVLALASCHLSLDIPNEYVAGFVAQNPGRAVGFASVDPNDREAVTKLRYAANDLGLRGLKLSPPYQGFDPHGPEAWKVFETVAELGLVLMFHQGGVFARRGVLEVAYPVLLDKVARSFPETKIVIAHMGQPWVHQTIAVMFKNQNVYADLSARFGRPWQLYNILLSALDYGVVDRILYGSDFPIFEPANCLRQFRAMATDPPLGLPGIDPALIEDVITNRPLSILGLEV